MLFHLVEVHGLHGIDSKGVDWFYNFFSHKEGVLVFRVTLKVFWPS